MKLACFLLIAGIIAGGWYLFGRSETSAAMNEAADAFVPSSTRMDRHLKNVEDARQVTELINSRQTFPRDDSD